MILTDDAQTAGYLDHLRNSGLKNRKELLEPSFNARMDTIQASFLLNRMSIENKLLPGVQMHDFILIISRQSLKTEYPTGIEHFLYIYHPDIQER